MIKSAFRKRSRYATGLSCLTHSARSKSTAFGIAFVLLQLLTQTHPTAAQSSAIENAPAIPLVVSVGATYGEHFGNTSIPALDNGTRCGTFTTGQAGGSAFWVGVKFPPIFRGVSFAPEISYQDLSTGFLTHPTTVEHGYQPGVGLVEIDRTRSYAASLSQLSFSPLFEFKPLGPLSFELGPSLGILLRHSFSETESITSPSTASYSQTNFSQSRSIGSGAISANTFQASIIAAAGIELNMGEWIITPQLRGSLALTNISTVVAPSWKVYNFGGGISLSRPIARSEDLSPSEPIIPAPAVTKPAIVAKSSPRPVLTVDMRVVGVGKNGEEIAEPTLTIEKIHVLEVFPTLNSIFFDDGEATIPMRYHLYRNSEEAKSFSEHDLDRADALEIHHHALDVIGNRLRHNPTATITLVGSRSASSDLDVGALSDISLDRATSVASYLENVWKIAPNCINLKAKMSPDSPSDESTAAGRAENRRVEILSTTSSILSPLWTERVERIASPPKLMFYPHIVQSNGIDSILLTVRQGNHILQRFDGRSDGSAGEHLWTLDETTTPDGEDSLIYSYRVVDSAGNVASTTGSIHLHQVQHETTVHQSEEIGKLRLERYSLILFDYSSSQFGKRQAELLIDTIARRLDAGATLTLTGHTDQTGDVLFNNRLSGERASTTAEALKQRLRKSKRPLPVMNVEAHGSRDILFDNSLPEGRFLSRTVKITVEHDDSQR